MDPGWAGEKWVPPEVMHLTLRFLGDVDSKSVSAFSAVFAAKALGIEPFGVRFTGLHAAPRAARASMIWATVADDTGRCRALAAAADAAAASIGVPQASHAFRPHITLARARHSRRLLPGTLDDVQLAEELDRRPAMSVLSATLFSSTLTRTGPVHEPLAEFVLGSSSGSDGCGSEAARTR
jgi:2'-5' RNA ligase